jgi:hypothetical protein
MEFDLALHQVGAIVWFRSSSTPALEPVQVRILGHHDGGIIVTDLLDISQAVPTEHAKIVEACDLHFERTAFEAFEPPSSGSRRTEPAPPPDFDPDPPTLRSPPSGPVTQRPISVEIASPMFLPSA